MKRMMLRDWQFRRQLLGIMPMLFFMIVGVLCRKASPFWPLIHVFALCAARAGIHSLMVCVTLPYGTDYKGVWLFLLASDSALARFAQGIHASMWLAFIIIPNALLFALFMWRWGIADAATFALYTVAVSSVYLAFGLRMDRRCSVREAGRSEASSGQPGGCAHIVFIILSLSQSACNICSSGPFWPYGSGPW